MGDEHLDAVTQPANVRIVLKDGTVLPVDTVYVGVDPDDGTHVWEVMTTVRMSQVKKLLVGMLPPHTTVEFPLAES